MDLKKIAREAPRVPGVYIMKNGEGRIIYVGKARVLRNRLVSYSSGEKDIKTGTLLRHVASIETIIVKDEYEALLLENTLIKQHNPKYNINLKDGKTYPVIRLTSGPYPRLFRTRQLIEDGSSYYGPFPNVGAMDDMLDIIDRVFPLRKCRTLRKRDFPCMYYHIGRCFAPCCKRITEAAYSLHVDRVRKLLSGNTQTLTAELKSEMQEEARALRFERAAQIRNAIKAIDALTETSTVIDFDPQGRDYIAWAAEGVLTTFSIFSMRGGKLTGRELYRTRSASEEEESLVTFITGYYNGGRLPPETIYIFSRDGYLPLDPAFPAKWFREQFGLEPKLLVPPDIHHRAVMSMVKQNAEEDLRRRIKERGAGPVLDELKNALGLKTRPSRIEGFDIAQLDGKHPVASLISFANGVPDKKNYRRFKLHSVIGVVDDFAAMREAVNRRYRRLLRENRELPDLILVDGGLGQVNAAKGVLDELGIHCDLVGLAKRDEEIWLPHTGKPLSLPRHSEALKVLQRVRDETHRFATSLNQILRSKDLRMETLESVEGIGAKRAAVLIRHYLGIEGIAAADPADIARVCGCGQTAARAVRAAARLAGQDPGALRSGPRNAPEQPQPGSAAALAAQALSAQGPPAETSPSAEMPPTETAPAKTALPGTAPGGGAGEAGGGGAGGAGKGGSAGKDGGAGDGGIKTGKKTTGVQTDRLEAGKLAAEAPPDYGE
ncbi:MAG: excinuclease ABC subunit UvrC [Spirochaetaceae bacterium]|jgi:excinuclease ABC subunit C|nr:excinuclease ABC subunit UvrC [Spirochaetaceae bacterium]